MEVCAPAFKLVKPPKEVVTDAHMFGVARTSGRKNRSNIQAMLRVPRVRSAFYYITVVALFFKPCAQGYLVLGLEAGVYRLIIFIDFSGTTTENYVQGY